MRPIRFFPLLAIICALLSAAAAKPQAAAPLVRIVNKIDENDLVTLKGNTHPFANTRNDRGRVSPDLPMTDLILVLSRDPEQQTAFDKFVASQYDPTSPNFHKWLSPEEVGADFGPSETDIATISNWLTGHGFSIGEVPRDRMSIRFSGTAAQVESTFHTEIHNLEVKGVQHIGNMSDPKIPEALTPVVVGVKSLHNFFARPMHRTGSKVTRDSATGKWRRVADTKLADSPLNVAARPGAPRPQYNTVDQNGDPIEDVAPFDFATIYNLLPLWNASTPIDGTGQTIAIAGTSDIALSDVTTFRSAFGLPAYTSSNQPTVVSGNSQPLTNCNTDPYTTICGEGDLIENTLDVEWSGSIAKGASIILVASYPASATDDNLYDSESYIVNKKTANIMNVSYGECELGVGTAGNVQYYDLWQTASTEGIAVFVASGDGGSAECDDGESESAGNPYSAQFGLAVNGLASTPYNTAVGGTDFNWCSLTAANGCTAAPYWNSTNDATNGSSAKGYVPEVPWNDTCSSSLALGYLEQQAQSVSAPTVSDAESACDFVYTNSIASGGGLGLSFLVDTVGGGGGASACVVGNGSDVSSCASSTTSTGSANGNITLVSDGWPKPSWQTGVAGIPSDGVRDLPDVSFFASDGTLSFSGYLICVSADGACSYSSTTEPLAQEVGGTSVSTPAMAGVMALINQKAGSSQGSPNAELYSLAAKQTDTTCSSENGTIGDGCYFNDVDTGTNAQACDYGAEEGNPLQTGIQSPGCKPIHSGDLIGILPGYSAGPGYDQATGLGSLNIANVVNAWPSATTGTGTATVTVTPAQATVSASSALSVSVTVASGTSGGTTPTGTVTLSGGGYTSSAGTLSSGAYTFAIPANSLSAGSDVLTVSYSGDTNYATVTGTATVTVTAAAGSGTATVTVTPAQTTLSASSALNVAVTVASSTSGGTTPTGTVMLSGGGYTSTAGTLSSGAFTVAIPANSLSAGSDVLTVDYSGDSNYAAASGTATVTVTGATGSGTATVTVTPAQTTLAASAALSVAVTVASSTSGGTTPTGTVMLSGGGYTSTAETLAAGAYTFSIPANSLTAGSDTLTVAYSGDSNYATASGMATVTVTSGTSSGTFTLSASATTAVAPGSQATSTITASTTTYSGTATLTCALTASPTGAVDLPTCALSPTTVALSSSATSGTATATVTTTAPVTTTTQLVHPDSPGPDRPGKGRGWMGAGSSVALAFLVLLGIPARRRSWRSMLGAVALMVALGSLAGCGDFWQAPGGNTANGTTAGTYTFTVTGTGDPTVTAVTTTFTVTVSSN
jgi:hypothetical protein